MATLSRDKSDVKVEAKKPRVLMIRHSCNWERDRCSHWLQCQGCVLDYVCPAQGDALPDAEKYSAAIVFGGVQSANDYDRFDWMRDELDWIEQFMSRQYPLLGICLGAQLIARTLGARVQRHPQQLDEIGFRPLYPTSGNQAFISPGQLMFQWHNEGFDLPAGAELLARGDQFPNQAYRYAGHVTGLQFHPEANPDVIQRWQAASAVEAAQANNAEPEAKQLQQARQLDEPITQWLEDFLEDWIGDADARTTSCPV